MLQANNLLLAVVLILAAYSWRRIGFRLPSRSRLSARAPRIAIATFGWALVAGVLVYDVAGVLAGRTQVAKSGHQYAWLEREPARFWREIVLQTIVIAGTGAVLIALTRGPTAHETPR